MIADVLWSAPDEFREFSAQRSNARAELGNVVEARLGEALTLFHDRFDRQPAPSGASLPDPAP
jgi:hypothetical protein